MKSESKSAPKCKKLVFFFLTLFLSACADVRGPQWLTGEPDEPVLNAPRVVGVPSGASDQSWPNLADVPDKKPRFSKLSTREADRQTLASDNMKAQAEMERIRNIQLDGEEGRTQETTQQDDVPFSALKP
ncbi:MAG: hypothetical protein WC612_05510 [Bdellovibrionales bacterium]|jgi:hypothetical protein